MIRKKGHWFKYGDAHPQISPLKPPAHARPWNTLSSNFMGVNKKKIKKRSEHTSKEVNIFNYL
jgi:hypothetical protein